MNGFSTISNLPLIVFLMMMQACWIDGVCGFSPSSKMIQDARSSVVRSPRPQPRTNMIGTGFSFEDGEQILVSVQKPLGIVLEQDEDGIIEVTDVDSSKSAGRAGVKIGDVLMAVQNASTEQVDLDSVLGFIQNGPRVINLRLKRRQE